MLKLLIDENLDQRILRGLQLRVAGLQYTVVQETALAGSPDAALLKWAAANPHVLVTHDRKTMLRAVYDQIGSGRGTAGSVIVKKELPLIKAIGHESWARIKIAPPMAMTSSRRAIGRSLPPIARTSRVRNS
jgi:hypothetical protein